MFSKQSCLKMFVECLLIYLFIYLFIYTTLIKMCPVNYPLFLYISKNSTIISY